MTKEENTLPIDRNASQGPFTLFCAELLGVFMCLPRGGESVRREASWSKAQGCPRAYSGDLCTVRPSNQQAIPLD